MELYPCITNTIRDSHYDQVFEWVEDENGNTKFVNDLCRQSHGIRMCLGLWDKFMGYPWVTTWANCDKAATWVVDNADPVGETKTEMTDFNQVSNPWYPDIDEHLGLLAGFCDEQWQRIYRRGLFKCGFLERCEIG